MQSIQSAKSCSRITRINKLSFPAPLIRQCSNHSVPQSPQQSVQRVAAFEPGQYRWATPADFFQRVLNAYVVACRDESLSKRFYRIAITPLLAVYLREI